MDIGKGMTSLHGGSCEGNNYFSIIEGFNGILIPVFKKYLKKYKQNNGHLIVKMKSRDKLTGSTSINYTLVNMNDLLHFLLHDPSEIHLVKDSSNLVTFFATNKVEDTKIYLYYVKDSMFTELNFIFHSPNNGIGSTVEKYIKKSTAVKY